ncbi:AAA family ATPase [Saccharicrinis aurantiacus]|uniref:AAA family ATPase n=1 Tax=Saccharicrinis aurantiacus TaxID=1849719 RepID=UPI0024936371|nr:MoxR family ATPase [Saccharicrinis aurantiacus]
MENIQRVDINQIKEKLDQVRTGIQKLLIGQDKTVELLLTALIADGHILLEGVPGIAKTLSAKLLAKLVNTNFTRIQFTPDLMPADLIGTSVYNAQKSDFEFKKGPLFSNIVLIDEINRAPAKTQSALFEVMEERSISVEGTTYKLDKPFLVVGTQNPIEHEGTYRLPEAQLDRFLFKIEMGFPTLEEETAILMRFSKQNSNQQMENVQPVLSADELIQLREQVDEIHVEESLLAYIAAIVNSTRNNPDIYLGASPRASLAILRSAKAFAVIQGRDFVTPDDIKMVATSALIHRIIPSAEKEIEGISSADIVQSILSKVEVPR